MTMLAYILALAANAPQLAEANGADAPEQAVPTALSDRQQQAKSIIDTCPLPANTDIIYDFQSLPADVREATLRRLPRLDNPDLTSIYRNSAHATVMDRHFIMAVRDFRSSILVIYQGGMQERSYRTIFFHIPNRLSGATGPYLGSISFLEGPLCPLVIAALANVTSLPATTVP